MVLALVATVSPALAGRLAPPDGFEEVPGYWRQTADFLAAEQPTGRALLVPGSSFGTYQWGGANDEAFQPLAESAWDVRSAIPLSPEGHIRVLDAIEERLALGEGSAGLTRYLARAGISHLVLRNDLDTGEARSTRSALVRQALRESPGIAPVASFGPVGTSAAVADGLVYDAGLDEAAPAIEVYAVDDTAPRAWTAPLADAVTVLGGPEARAGAGGPRPGHRPADPHGRRPRGHRAADGDRRAGPPGAQLRPARRRHLRRPHRRRPAPAGRPGPRLRRARRRVGRERGQLHRRHPDGVELGVGPERLRGHPPGHPAVVGGRRRPDDRLAAGALGRVGRRRRGGG